MLSRFLVAVICATLFAPAAHAVDLERDNVAAFIDRMVSEHDYDRATLQDILAGAEIKDSIVERISKPAEKTLDWGEYRPIFLTRERIRAGAAFWREHREALEAICERTGVPVEMMVAIIGVETYYGRITGGHRVIDALTTLAFNYPPRSKFFTSELEHFLLLIREEQMPANEAFGSYAGAMGRPQFMPSSYRAYAVDSTGDGKRDIWNNWTDVAGSVANYFVAHGWAEGQPVVARAKLGDMWHGPVPKNTLKPADSVASLSKAGVLFSTELPGDSEAQLLTLDGADGAEHWVGFHNFFVITRYNHSVMYAMAVHQLAEAIAAEVGSD